MLNRAEAIAGKAASVLWEPTCRSGADCPAFGQRPCHAHRHAGPEPRAPGPKLRRWSTEKTWKRFTQRLAQRPLPTNGRPEIFLLTPVQGSEYGQADALIEGLQGYDSDAFVELIQRNGAEAVIPSRGNRLTPRKLDRPTYKARNLVELFSEESTVPVPSHIIRRAPATSPPVPCPYQ